MLSDVLARRRVIACVGSGGVGKTTISAALGVRAAMLGRKALVLTIDPARRLANSLGLATLGNVETRIAPEQFEKAGLTPRGELWAMTLDLRRTWDDIVTRYAPTAEKRETILSNRLYRQLSTQLAGSLEYMAMEKVYELSRDRDYDLLVLDTPPTAHALDFLHAPDRLLDVLDQDAVSWLLKPAMAAGRVALNVLHPGTSFVAKTLARFTGVELLQELSEFVFAFQGMYEGFKERAANTRQLLASDESAFVLVTSPRPLPVDEAVFFARQLQESGIRVAAAVVNRVHTDPAASGGAREAPELALELAKARLPNEGHPHLSERLETTIAELGRLAAAERAEIERFRQESAERIPVHLVPSLPRDVHDLGGLWMVDRLLFEGAQGESAVAPPAL